MVNYYLRDYKMLKVSIEPSQALPSAIDTRTGNTNGRDWTMRNQHCWIFKPASLYPELYVITLPEDVPFYPAGDYLLDFESMITPNAYKSISLSRGGIVLKPASDATKKPVDYTAAKMAS